jgi:diguanylate cyclase (GGDEF)-like protein
LSAARGTPGPAPRRGSTRALSWVALTLGLLLSVGVALGTRAALLTRADAVVSDAVDSVADEVRAALDGDLDLAHAARSHLALTLDDDGAASLQEWFAVMEVERRFPEIGGVGFVQRVPVDDLATYAADNFGMVLDPERDPAAQLGIVPSGPRSHYCLAAAGVSPVPFFGEGVQFVDLCAGPVPTADGGSLDATDDLAATAASGEVALRPVEVAGVSYLSVFMPVTVGPDGTGEVLGWVAGVVDADAVLAGALPERVDLHATMVGVTADGSVDEVASAGTTDADAPGTVQRIEPLEIVGGWHLDVDVKPPSTIADANLAALGAGASGLIVLGLVVALVRVMATSKERAWELVRARTAELSHQALHDPLTGLPNRSLVADRADQLLARARRDGGVPAALFLDLDGFKTVNDTFGHHAGDQLLVAAAHRLRTTVRDAETVGRIGGDEFVVLLDGRHDGAGVAAVAQRIVEAFSEPFDLGDLGDDAVVVGASIGIAIGLRPTADDLLRDADTALYEAKAAGKGRYVVFRADMQDLLQERISLERQVRRALTADALELRYVPSFDLDTGRLLTAEAQVHWEGWASTALSPDDVRAVLHESGVAIPLGRWALRQACQDVGAWRRELPDVAVALEVSPRQFTGPHFADEVAEALEQADVPGAALVLELDESLLLAPPGSTTRAVIDQVRALGVRVAAGDFARRYLALEQSGLPADVLKIPAGFVEGLGSYDHASTVVRTIVALGHGLGMVVIAEGPDRPDVRELLKKQRCDGIQSPLSGDALSSTGVVGLAKSAESASTRVRTSI